MSLREGQRLRTFALVLDLGSISAAADVLGYTQSAVSQQLATLEREVGVALIDRTQRPLRPTPAGATLRPHVERALAALGTAEAVLEDLRSGIPRLRLASFASALSSFVPAAVRDLRRTHDQIVVEVQQLETNEAFEQVRAGAADVAVIHHEPPAGLLESSGLRRRRLVEDHLHVVLPEGHRLARRDVLSVADLEDEPLVLPRRDTPAGRFRSVVERLCSQAGFAPLVAYELDDLPAAQAFAAAGVGVVVMHGLTLATLPAGATARPLAEQPTGSRMVEAIAAPSPVADALLDRLAAAAATRSVSPRARPDQPVRRRRTR